MRDLAVLLLHLLATVARLAGPGGVRAVVTESVVAAKNSMWSNPGSVTGFLKTPAVRWTEAAAVLFGVATDRRTVAIVGGSAIDSGW